MNARSMNEMPVAPAALHPLRLTRNEAQARTSIAQKGQQLALRMADTDWCVNLVPVVATPPARPGTWSTELEWAGASFFVEVPTEAINQLLEPLLDGSPLPALPPELATAVLEAALGEVLATLQALGRGRPHVLSLKQDRAEVASCPHVLHLRVMQPEAAAALEAYLRTDGLGLLLIAGLLAPRPASAPDLGDDWVLRLPAEFGFTDLSESEFKSLQPGDAVLLSASYIHAERILWLSEDGESGLQAQLPALADVGDISPTPPALAVVQAWSTHMPPVEPTTDVSSLDSLPIHLSFDLGEVTLTLGQARSLSPGQTLELARPLSGGVRIRANGAVIGEGDLVEIDGQLGISIRTLSLGAA